MRRLCIDHTACRQFLRVLLYYYFITSYSPLKNNDPIQASSATSQPAANSPSYPRALEVHLEEYDPYKAFLVNGSDESLNRAKTMSQTLRGWEEIWNRTNDGARGAQGELGFVP